MKLSNLQNAKTAIKNKNNFFVITKSVTKVTDTNIIFFLAANCKYLVFFFHMNDENDENRIISKKAENFLPESNPGYWAKFPSSVPTELRTHEKI
jgi:hypothetical protein